MLGFTPSTNKHNLISCYNIWQFAGLLPTVGETTLLGPLKRNTEIIYEINCEELCRAADAADAEQFILAHQMSCAQQM
jgi:hypothetical protein